MSDLLGSRPTLADRAGRFVAAIHRRLPGRLQNWIDPELIGFALLGGFTFCIDVIILLTLKKTTHLPFLACIAIGYVLAFSLNFVLNRSLNFKSHAPAGPQAMRFAVVVVLDFCISVFGTKELTELLGWHPAISRLIAGACVATLTYTLSRFWVFRDTLQHD
ncbi:GtrA family protein [Pseudonocardiaceae bacterium YIM PH 21723]|nr:GtrA family protein [Pseudonocardiaceae bacterium YIM PH 21723]